MDFSKFTFSKKYVKGGMNFELFFDFDLKEATGHNRKTFDDYKSLLFFLENNTDRKIFITQTQTQDSFEEGSKIVINLRDYQEFSKRIGQSGKNRTQAFLSQKLKHYSEDEKKEVLAASLDDEIVERIKSFTDEQRSSFLEKLKDVQGVKLPEVAILVTDSNKKQILEQVLEQNPSDEFWSLISSSYPELAEKILAGHLQVQRKKVIDELKRRLTGEFHETKGDDSWQAWIYAHNWLLGANYQKPIEKQKINISGIMPDYLFPTLDGFVDVLEIKLPSFEVIEEDENHKGSWAWSSDSNYAIGQVVNYLCEIDRLRLEIERGIQRAYAKQISMLKPRAFILIGQSNSWNQDKKEALRKLNHSLHGIEVLTYSDLIGRGEAFIETGSQL